jgi:hypothetical protein
MAAVPGTSLILSLLAAAIWSAHGTWAWSWPWRSPEVPPAADPVDPPATVADLTRSLRRTATWGLASAVLAALASAAVWTDSTDLLLAWGGAWRPVVARWGAISFGALLATEALTACAARDVGALRWAPRAIGAFGVLATVAFAAGFEAHRTMDPTPPSLLGPALCLSAIALAAVRPPRARAAWSALAPIGWAGLVAQLEPTLRSRLLQGLELAPIVGSSLLLVLEAKLPRRLALLGRGVAILLALLALATLFASSRPAA